MSEGAMSETRAAIDWPRRTFTYGPVTVTVERQTVGHSIVISSVLAALPDYDEPGDKVFAMWFARIAAQTVDVDGLDVAFPKLGASDDEWAEAFETFKRMDGQLMNQWMSALTDVDRAPNAQEFWPSHKLDEEARKNQASADSHGKVKSGASSQSTTKKAK